MLMIQTDIHVSLLKEFMFHKFNLKFLFKTEFQLIYFSLKIILVIGSLIGKKYFSII